MPTYPNDETEDWLKGSYWPFTTDSGEPVTSVVQLRRFHPGTSPWVLLTLPVARAMPASLRTEIESMPLDPDDYYGDNWTAPPGTPTEE